VVVGVGAVEAVISIVGRPFLWVGEDGVGGGDFCEAVAGGCVGAVAVGVVAEGEGVEFSKKYTVFSREFTVGGEGRGGVGLRG
jgi:hypothetical protein